MLEWLLVASVVMTLIGVVGMLARRERIVRALAATSIFLTFFGFVLLPATWGYSAYAFVAGVVLAIVCVIARVREWWGWAAIAIATIFIVGFVFWSGAL